MSKQPEALRLADMIDAGDVIDRKAADELRKLYELNGILLQKCHTLEKMLANAVQIERQACIDICDAEAEQWQSPKYHYAMAAAVHCARKIKNRNQ